MKNEIEGLINRFAEQNIDQNKSVYNEAQLRREFIDPFIEFLGWDIANKQGATESYKEVVYESNLMIEKGLKTADYCIQLGGRKQFYIEAKKPSINIRTEIEPAGQIRRYGWSAKMSACLLTNFEEFAVYDTTIKPHANDKALKARIFYCRYEQLNLPSKNDPSITNYRFIYNLFSKEAVSRGALERLQKSDKKRGTQEVDVEFLKDIEEWREKLANNLCARNDLNEKELNFSVQIIIDRIIFLRICEDRQIEEQNQLKEIVSQKNIYSQLKSIFKIADEKYNSGLFHFRKEHKDDVPDTLTLALKVDDKVLKDIINKLYYPAPYEFSVMPADILGSVYERFLGNVIRKTSAHRIKIEEKIEVRKSGGVYYTPKHIVDYIVQNTIGEQLKNKNLNSIDEFSIVDPACGSGSFLIVAYQYMLDWYLQEYVKSPKKYRNKQLIAISSGNYKLSMPERRRILSAHIFGVDVDSQAVEVTKLSLLLKALEGQNKDELQTQFKIYHIRALPNLCNNIKCGNSIVGTNFYANPQNSFLTDKEEEKINAFDFDVEFKNIFKNGGFDAIIGNPPYIGVKKQDISIRRYIKDAYSYSSGADLYISFIEKAFYILKNEGYISYIIPNKFLASDYGKKIRTMLRCPDLSLKISKIWDIKDEKVFTDALITTVVVSFIKTSRTIDITVKDNISEKIVTNIFDNYGRIQINHDCNTKNIIDKISSGKTFDDISDIRTGIMGFEYNKMESIISEKSDTHSVPLLVNGNFSRYIILWGNKSVRLHNKKIRSPFIKLNSGHINKTTENLFLHKPKIIIRGVAKQVTAVIDNLGHAMLVGVHSMIAKYSISNLFLLGIVNSNLINWYHIMTQYALKIPMGSLKYPISFFKNMPFPDFDISNKSHKIIHDKIAGLVNQMMILKENANSATLQQEKTSAGRKINALDKQIDSIVYGLYRLTEEDIKIIEESL